MNQNRPTNPLNFANFGNSEHLREELAAGREHTLVGWVLKRIKQGHKQREMLSKAEEELGRTLLTFDMFNDAFPTFPIRLHFNGLCQLNPPLYKNPKSLFPCWFRDFKHLPIIHPYSALFAMTGHINGVSKPLGMIFPRKGFQQGMILHNGGEYPRFVPTKSTCMIYHGSHGVDLTVQPFLSFIDHIVSKTDDGLAWEPED